MAQVGAERKRQFCGNAAIEVGKPEVIAPGKIRHVVTGADGTVTEHVTDVRSRSKRPARRVKSGNQKIVKNKETFLHRNTLADIVRLGPSATNVKGVLWAVGNWVALASMTESREPSAREMRFLMRMAAPTATDAAIAKAANASCGQPPQVGLSRREIGVRMGVTFEGWALNGAPSYVWPGDRTVAWTVDYIGVQRRELRRGTKQRSYKKHEGKNHKPQDEYFAERLENSDRAFCARYADRGVSDRTLRYHKKKGDVKEWLARKGITELPPTLGHSYNVYSNLNIDSRSGCPKVSGNKPAPRAPAGNVIDLAAVRAGIMARTLAISRIGEGAARIVAGMTVAAVQLGHAYRQILEEDELATKGDTGDVSADAIPANQDDSADGASTAGRQPERGADAPPPRGATPVDPTGEDGLDLDAMPAWFRAEAEERARKHARMAERAAQAQSAAPTGKTTPKDRGAPTAAPRRPQGTLRHPAWGDAGHQPSTGGRAPGNPPNQGSAGRHPPARVVYSGYNRGVADG